MKKTFIVKLMSFVTCAVMAFGTCGVTSMAASSVQSQDSIGGHYANGSCSYSEKSASSITSHNLYSYKYAKLRASFRHDNDILPAAITDNTSTSAGLNAHATATLSSSSQDYFLGCMGHHKVIYNGITWEAETESGINYYGW